jgi:hypothetical protein
MTYLIAHIPDPETLSQRLKEQHWIDYYSKFDSFNGDSEGIKYLVDFFKKRFASMPESSYY